MLKRRRPIINWPPSDLLWIRPRVQAIVEKVWSSRNKVLSCRNNVLSGPYGAPYYSDIDHSFQLTFLGLILCEEPFYNEAGYEKHKGSREGAENSRMYNEMVIIKMLQSLERIFKHPPEAFKNEVDVYCKQQLPG